MSRGFPGKELLVETGQHVGFPVAGKPANKYAAKRCGVPSPQTSSLFCRRVETRSRRLEHVSLGFSVNRTNG